MNNFVKNMSMSCKDIRLSRAQQVSMAAEIQQQNLINALKGDVVLLELELNNLLDFAPNSTTSLQPTSQDWDAQDWVSDVHNHKTKIRELKIELAIAQATYNDLFKETTE